MSDLTRNEAIDRAVNACQEARWLDARRWLEIENALASEQGDRHLDVSPERLTETALSVLRCCDADGSLRRILASRLMAMATAALWAVDARDLERVGVVPSAARRSGGAH
jgi:hypothetical protein